MAASSRRKGVEGEREVAAIFAAAGFDVRQQQRNRKDAGDLFVGARLYVETKRQERMKLAEWIKQAGMDTPDDRLPVVAFRQNRGEWYACLPLAALVELAS
jgi:Holliday junction resolvase